MDAFNYNQWGLGKATVYEIDRNLTINEQQSYFRVRCKLQTKELVLKNDYKAQFKKGMTCTARLVLTERSLWHLLFDKVDDWFNPKIVDSV
jgi:HlyD family secretion protein